MADIPLDEIPMPAVLPSDVNSGTALCIIAWALFGASTVLISGRLVSKIFILRRFGVDDALMLLSWVR